MFQIFFVLLHANLRRNFQVSKKNNQKLTNVGLQTYYDQLPVGERGKLIVYIINKLGMSYATWQGKFIGKRQKFTIAELIALEPIINEEQWRQ